MALSCIETEGLDEIPKGEICMSPVLSDMAKTRAESTTSPYPDGNSFGAFACYSQTEAGQPWTGTIHKYFANHEFKSASGVCSGVEPVYWPLEGSLVFAGYSPYDKNVAAEFDASSATLSITEYDVDGTKNLMYFLPELTDGKHVGHGKTTSSLPVKFSHAMSCLAFNFVKGDGNKTVTLKRVWLSNVYTKASFSVSASNPSSGSWSDMQALKNELTIWEGEQVLSASPLEIEAYVIPGEAKDIVIAYHIEGESDDKVKTLSPSDIATWAISTKNTYNITINSMGELLLTPTVTIAHINDNDGKLAGSNVAVNLGNLSQEDLDRISDLKIVVSNGSDNPRVYEQNGQKLTSSIVNMPYGLTLPYLKQGNYNINVSYNDGVKDQTVTVTATSPAPIFTVTVSGAKRSGSHTNTGATIDVISSVSISDNVLKQLPLSDCQVSLSGLTTWYVGSANTTTSQFMDKAAEGKWENNYTLTSEVTFDGKKVSASSTTVSLQPSTYYKVLDKSTAVVVQKAADLKDGGYYFIRLKESQTRSVWVCNSSTLQLLVNTSYVGDNVFGKEYPNSYVFKFCKLNVSVTDNEYKSVIVGTFRSQYRYTQSSSNCYVTWDGDSVIDFDGPINQNYMLYIANRWGSETDPYMDIYQYKSSNTPKRGSDMLGRVGPNVKVDGEEADNNIKWGTTFWGANNARKFEIIEVIPQ